MGGCCSLKQKKIDALSLHDDLTIKPPVAEGELNTIGRSMGPEGDRSDDVPSGTGLNNNINIEQSVLEPEVDHQAQQRSNMEEGETTLIPHDELTWVKALKIPSRPKTFPYFVTSPVEEMHLKLFQDVIELLINEGMFHLRTHPPIDYKPPEELKNLIDLSLPNLPKTHDQLLDLIKAILKYQPHTGHPFFMEQRIAGLEPYSIASDMVATVSNSNNVLYICSSTVTTLLELEFIRAVCQLVGYDSLGDGDGTVTSGVSLALTYAMRMSMKLKYHHLRHTGLNLSKRPVFFVSKHSTYIPRKCAIFQGFGLESIIPIEADANGKMSMSDLKVKYNEAITLGHIPVAVIGTAGTSVLRAIDPLTEIADFCKDHNLWFHCDATFGGTLLFSKKLRGMLSGVEQSDSFTWSQHFVTGVAPTCTILVVPPRHREKLTAFHGLGEGSAYGFMKTPLYDPRYDVSHNTITSSRRPEMLKSWFMWKAKGTIKIGKHMEQIYNNSQYCLEVIKERTGFEPILDKFEGTNVCFFYVPIHYMNLDRHSPEFRKKVSLISVGIRKLLLTKGSVCLSYYEYREYPTFLVMGLHNSAVTKADILYVLDKIQILGDALSDSDFLQNNNNNTFVSTTS